MEEVKEVSEFIKELNALLEKHKACIDLMIDGDTDGIYGESIEVSILLPGKDEKHFAQWTEPHKLIDGDSYSFIDARQS